MTPKEHIQAAREEKHFRLPKQQTGSIDEAIDQLDLATSNFALHQNIYIATEVSIAARRYVSAVENHVSKKGYSQRNGHLDPILARFYQDVKAVSRQFTRMKESYQKRMISDKRIKKLETQQHIRADCDTVGYYLTLLYDQVNRVTQLTTEKNDSHQPKNLKYHIS